jgi:hypothetical protein
MVEKLWGARHAVSGKRFSEASGAEVYVLMCFHSGALCGSKVFCGGRASLNHTKYRETSARVRLSAQRLQW